MKQLWQNQGKPKEANGKKLDQSSSGYDYSIAKRLVFLGKRDLNELATILTLRPEEAVQQSGKSQDYLKRTLEAVL